MGKKNIVFNLTIDDLKELGIIKPRRRRRRTNKIMQYLQQQQPNNIKSTSEQMTGYSNVFNNNNTSNLQTENLRLQNNLLDKYPMLKNEANNNNNNINESRFKTIEDDNRKLNVFANHLLSTTYRPAIINKYHDDNLSPIKRRVESIDDNDPNHIVHNDDNNDVAATGGSDEFKTHDNKNDDPQPEINEKPQPEPEILINATPQPQLQQIVQSPEQQQQKPFQSVKHIGIRSPFKMLLKSIRPSRNQNVPDSIHEMANNTPVDISIPQIYEMPNNTPVYTSNPQQGYNYKLRDDGSEYPELTEESLQAHNEENDTQTVKTQTAYQIQKARREQAIEEYKALGGNKKEILESKTLGPIRMETVLLQSQLEQPDVEPDVEPEPQPARPKRNKTKIIKI